MPFYKVGMKIKPHPDVPGIPGEVTRADDDWFEITWDDGEVDTIAQVNAEEPDWTVEQ